MEEAKINKKQEKKVEALHWEIQQWKSNFKFIADELIFIHKLLDSYVFEPNTPNLFERIQGFKEQLKKRDEIKKEVQNHISRHENNLAGMLECTNVSCDFGYYQKHDELQKEVDQCHKDFQQLKAEIFNYAGGVLKKRKP
ncbi:hypothetical protein MTsPCn9_29470 [Croceitalea sp. MTPC9]|uniref:hypothetical protein n=1 Tax=unclassified Croceitalea TaxID=2632280 RepID=UPI002B3E2641|nr:hypothetical protein MTsPCn6_30960 [Croceitalea sp. MTPC6]GMN18007.1 hypothetical protein MTsPCn9_29470 [Croceitalea sp. MTPC9]